MFKGDSYPLICRDLIQNIINKKVRKAKWRPSGISVCHVEKI